MNTGGNYVEILLMFQLGDFLYLQKLTERTVGEKVTQYSLIALYSSSAKMIY